MSPLLIANTGHPSSPLSSNWDSNWKTRRDRLRSLSSTPLKSPRRTDPGDLVVILGHFCRAEAGHSWRAPKTHYRDRRAAVGNIVDLCRFSFRTDRIRAASFISWRHKTSCCETGPDFTARLSSSSSFKASSRVMSNLLQCKAGLDDRCKRLGGTERLAQTANEGCQRCPGEARLP